MATGQFIVATIKEHIPIEGADRIVSSVVYGEALILGKADNPIGTRGIIIDAESKIHPEIVSRLNMYRHSEYNLDKSQVGYMHDDCRVRQIRLKGCKCTALFLSFEQLEKVVGPISLDDGIQSNEINKIAICEKYVRKYNQGNSSLGKSGKAREDLTPLFKEHFATGHLLRNLHLLENGDNVVITLKQHGTSGRASLTPRTPKRSFWDRLLGRHPQTQYAFAVGSRKVVKSVDGVYKQGQSYYDTDIWSLSAERFKNLLQPGETVYYEIIGYIPTGEFIHGCQSTEKLKKFLSKEEYEFTYETYGDRICMVYGCEEGEYRVQVYRMSLTNEQGVEVDYSWNRVKLRCNEMGVEHVPEIMQATLTKHIDDIFVGGVRLENLANQLVDVTPDPIEPSTLREGIVLRVDKGKEIPLFLKHKSFRHKVLENIIKDNTDYVDIEEIETV